jgi:hypothetical protein
MSRWISRLSYFNLTLMLTASLVLGGGAAAVATGGGDRGPTAQVAGILKKQIKRRAGTYQGTTEEGGTVSFTITRKGRVVGFKMPNVPTECRVLQQGNPPPYPGTPFTITAPPMRLTPGPKFLYEDPVDRSRAFQGIHVDGKGDSGGGMKGNAAMISWNGPYFQEGTVECYTAYVDWSARRIGRRK